ncbi:putative acetyltransferase [Trypanosoma cruzi]|uniref:N-alpha-acetyltransferase 60 n=2 Tax=Trypanosoma cruzi TaxID=5693 RepID=Q4DLL2_TRYCC|nr:acetyltransferase, putative [Trypanosoma cruzi]EAN93400.1 acetyltransferase, putative [Trypanosoma cruzi]PWV04478.1 putative acetyltransferase [Trypanosoma cruzi]|eukprot:XP_815251.1 acetyltransferase [Trypanosoma cruzi strain CL Brener]
MSGSEIVRLPPRGGVPIEIKLRWGIQKEDLTALGVLHDAAFPVKYESEYYDWMLTDSCLALLAFATENCILSLLKAAEHQQNTETERDEENSFGDVEDDGSSSLYSVMVGFCIGQIAYGQRRDGRIDASPTGYLGSFAVDSRMQRCGVGGALLDRFLSYMFFTVSVPPHLFLDYSPPYLGCEGLWGLVSSAYPTLFDWMSRWWFGRDRKGTNHVPQETLKDKKLCDSVNPTVDSQSGRIQYGVGEVWLHCIAADTKLLLYYMKRGFSRVLVAPNFYFFGGRYHEGALLVCRKDGAVIDLHDLNSARATGKKLEDGAGQETFIAKGLSHGFRLRSGNAVFPATVSEEDSGEGEIVDLLLMTDLAGLRRKWRSSVGKTAFFSDLLAS